MLEVVAAAESWQRTVNAGLTPELLRCPTCHTAHADTGQYAVHRHIKHVCTRCGNMFSTASQLACVGNPLASLPMLTSISGKLSVEGGFQRGIGSCPEAAATWAGDRSAIGECRNYLVVAAECG